MGLFNKNHTIKDRGAASSLRAGIDVTRGAYEGLTVVHKFGRNDAVGTSIQPVALGGNYRTPSTLTSLEVVSDSANDTAAGSGARKVKVQGLSTGWVLTEEEITLNGTTPVALANQYFRIFRAFVSESGSYATQSTPSHAGQLTIQESGAGDEWTIINDVSVFAKSQSQIACYTVPAGYSAVVKSVWTHVESTKPANIYFFQRQDADVVSAPYSAMRLVQEWDGVDGQANLAVDTPLGPFPSKTDIGFMAKVATGTAAVSIDFEIILIEE